MSKLVKLCPANDHSSSYVSYTSTKPLPPSRGLPTPGSWGGPARSRRERPRSPGQQPASLRPPSLALRAGSVPSGPGPAAEPLGGKVLRAEPAVWPEGGRASPVSRLFAGLAAPWRSGVHFAGPCVRMRSEGPASLCRAGLSSRPAPSAENTVLSPPNLPGALPKFLDNQS